MNYETHGVTRLSEFMGDHVVYRKLVPADPTLPTVNQLRSRLGLQEGILPRKAEVTYGRVVAEMLRAARAQQAETEIERLLYIGDTELNDGTAYRNICAAGPWPGWAFIGRDTPGQTLDVRVEDTLYLANRWSALPAFLDFVQERGLALDPGTAVVIDMDKTAVGARGRNDHVINEARVEGVQRTVAHLLGDSFDQDAFEQAYAELNKTIYHPFTTDNQDILAYICLILGAGLFELDTLADEIGSGALGSFEDFIGRVQARKDELAASGLTSIHADVWQCVQQGDPTPFKAFRYNEYLTTSERFGDLPGGSVEDLLSQRIVITQEVREIALKLRSKGALIFGVSDKPDEASVPNPQQAAAGMKALHDLPTVAIGSR